MSERLTAKAAAVMNERTHRELIDELVAWSNGRIKTQSFHRTFHPYLMADEDQQEVEADGLSVQWLKDIFPYVPDAFKIMRRLRVVTLYEVEVNYQVPHRKLLDIGKLSLHLVCYDWHVRLVRVDRYGRTRVEDIRDLAATYLAHRNVAV